MKKAMGLWFALFPVLLLASGLELKVLLLQDTVLPAEPIWIRVVALNSGTTPLQIPDVARYHPNGLFLYSFRSATGRSYGYQITARTFPALSLDSAILAPGESLVSGLWQVLYSFPKPSHAIMTAPLGALPPGRYTVGVRWQDQPLAHLADGAALLAESSAPAILTVRKPDSAQQVAANLYEQIINYESDNYGAIHSEPLPKTPEERTRLRWMRVEALAREEISQHPIEPYVVLAGISLFKNFRERYAGGPHAYLIKPEDIPAWKDSARSAYLDVVHRYPDSPHVQMLLRATYLSEIEDYAHERLLAELLTKYPGTRAALEAARQLAGSKKSAGQK
jgi:hypothetical protein